MSETLSRLQETRENGVTGLGLPGGARAPPAPPRHARAALGLQAPELGRGERDRAHRYYARKEEVLILAVHDLAVHDALLLFILSKNVL